MVRPEAPVRRDAQVLGRDDAILDAALALVDEAGWARLTVTPVCESTELPRLAVKERFPDRPALGAALWSERLAAPLCGALQSVVDACPEAGSTGSPTALGMALRPFMEPDQDLRAAVELLVVGRYDAAVGAAVERSLGPWLQRWLSAAPGGLSSVQAARRGYLLALALGLLAQARCSPFAAADFSHQVERLDRALRTEVAPMPLPPDEAHHIDRAVDFGSGDQTLEELLRATLDHVGRYGYEAATIDQITRAAHCPRGLLFAKYESKRDLFIDASDRMMESAANANYEFWERLASAYGPAVAEAVIMREFCTPERYERRTVALEQQRLAWHDSRMLAKVASSLAEAAWQLSQSQPEDSPREIRSHVHLGTALGQGTMLLADLYPAAYRLPMDVVTVPLMAQD